MAQFTNQFDIICDKLHATAIYAHHHSKGAKGQLSAQDRSSGSGVFARDPDGIIDFSELEMDDKYREEHPDLEYTDTGWQVECITREFKKPRIKKVWFRYPLHVVDAGDLDPLLVKGDPRLDPRKTPEERWEEKKQNLITAYDANNFDGTGVSIIDLARHLSVSEKTIVNHVERFNDVFELNEDKTKVIKKEEVDL